MKKAKLFLAALFLVASPYVYADEVHIPTTTWSEKGYVKVFTTDSSNFYRYLNPRFNYRVFVPACITKAQLPVNGDGVFFVNDDRTVRFTPSGGLVRAGTREYYESSIRELGAEHVTYATYGDGWYVVTGVKNGKIYYTKGLVGGQRQCSFTFEYPYAQKEQYDWMIPELEKNIVFL